MKIKQMFKDDIDRTINGVVKVEQTQEEVIEQEVREYVVTTELKKHFVKFFDEYSESFEKPTDNVGVWITGFFGSGKSHFLKMLSYLLENKEINGKKTVDCFEEKFDDPLSFMNIQKCVKYPTETILFNIDAKSSTTKDNTSVLKIFYKVFYDHIGLYGDDLKLARLEQFMIKRGKLDAFKTAFEEINGESWEDTRAEYNFFETDVVEALVTADVMNEADAQHWFDHVEITNATPEQFAKEVKEYVDTKPVIDSLVAQALLAGIMLDTRNFVIRSGVRTFEAAAYLKSRSANTVEAKKLFSNDMEIFRLRNNVIDSAERYRDFCAISVAEMQTPEIRLVTSQAADEMLNIEGIKASFVLYKNGDEINISARSFGEVNVQLIMETLGGGGHQAMSACQLGSSDMKEAVEMLERAIDQYTEKYINTDSES